MKSYHNGSEYCVNGDFTFNEDHVMKLDTKSMKLYYYNYIPPGFHEYTIIERNNLYTHEHRVILTTNINVEPREKEIIT